MTRVRRAVMLARVEPHDVLARYLSLSPNLSLAWEGERAGRDACALPGLFVVLAAVVRRALGAGEHAGLPAIFVEVERSLATGEAAEVEAATWFLEQVVDLEPAAHVHAMPWLGGRSLARWRAWSAGARDPFLSASEAQARLIGPLSDACPAVARGWPKAAPHVSAVDGTTTVHGIADFCFEVIRAALAAGDDGGVQALLAALEGPLAGTDRAVMRAFERGFLERLRELSLAQLDRVRPLLGARARRYWCVHLRLGEPRFGAWEERGSASGPRLVPATTFARGDAWGWKMALPRGDLGGVVRERLIHADAVVGEDETPIDGSDEMTARWDWNEADPAGSYALELWLESCRLARFEFRLD